MSAAVPPEIRLRPAVLEDAELVFRWRNDPFILARGSSQRPVSWDEHRRWFEETVAGRQRQLFLALLDGRPAGQVRFDRSGADACVISVYLLEEFTGKGHGLEVIRRGCQEVFRLWGVRTVIACVRGDNARGRSAFLKVGFVEQPRSGLCPADHVALTLARPDGSTNTPAWRDDDERNLRYYADLVHKHGTDVRSLDWGSRESQFLRFAVLAGVGRLHGATVLDVGCGLGDLLLWLRDAGVAVDYTGLDLTPPMVEVARRRFPGERFEVGSLLDAGERLRPSYDFVFASGIFTHRQRDAADFLRATVGAMFRRCTKAVAFNSLSGWATQKDAGEFYADPPETLAFCRTLTPWVALRHDYHPRDFTIYLYRERHA